MNWKVGSGCLIGACIASCLAWSQPATADTWTAGLVDAVSRMAASAAQSDNLAGMLVGVANVKAGPKSCPTAVTIAPSGPIVAGVLGFLDDMPCQGPAPLMLMQLGIQAPPGVLGDLRMRLASAFGAPCQAAQAGSSRGIAVWRRPDSIIALSSGSDDAGPETLSLLATALTPHTQAARERYRAVTDASSQALPASCR